MEPERAATRAADHGACRVPHARARRMERRRSPGARSRSATGAAWIRGRDRTPALPAETRLEIATPPTNDPISFAISPDARRIVFVSTSNGQSLLWLRSLDAPRGAATRGTEAASYPFWSPDGRSVGFFANGKLKRLDIGSGRRTNTRQRWLRARRSLECNGGDSLLHWRRMARWFEPRRREATRQPSRKWRMANWDTDFPSFCLTDTDSCSTRREQKPPLESTSARWTHQTRSA